MERMSDMHVDMRFDLEDRAAQDLEETTEALEQGLIGAEFEPDLVITLNPAIYWHCCALRGEILPMTYGTKLVMSSSLCTT